MMSPTAAKEAMFFHTDTADAPWTVIKSDDKKRARLNCIRHFLNALDYPGKDFRVAHEPDPLLVGRASREVEEDHRDDQNTQLQSRVSSLVLPR